MNKKRMFLKKAQENPFINGEVDIREGDPFKAIEEKMTEDKFIEFSKLEEMVESIQKYNIKNEAYIYRNIAVINQDSGISGGEWAVFQIKDGKTKQVESLTTGLKNEKKEKKWLLKILKNFVE